MSFSDDSMLAKLSSLNETQESIVTVAQWVLFHKRHAKRAAELWFLRLKESSPNKKLNLVYLANEVVQQSKARMKEDFLVAFTPVIAEATATAYKGATTEVQLKLRRVVEVWKQRQIFEPPIQEAIQARIDDIDRSRASGGKGLLGRSLGGGSNIPLEMEPLVKAQVDVKTRAFAKISAVETATQEYDRLTDPATPIPTPPVHAARLSSLYKSLANAEGAVSESMKSRQTLIEGLVKLLDANRAAFKVEEEKKEELGSQKAAIEAKKREVEDKIMSGLAEENHLSSPGSEPPASRTAGVDDEPARPEVEGLTPPAVEALTPTGTPPRNISVSAVVADDDFPVNIDGTQDRMPVNDSAIKQTAPAAGIDLLSSLSMPQSNHVNGGGPPSSKKRKLDDTLDDQEDVLASGGVGLEGLDDDVAEMLRQG